MFVDLIACGDQSVASSNPLDSNAPAKRGKERENPKPKKPSALKKVILKEREAKKQLRLNDEPASAIDTGVDSMLALSGNVDFSGEGTLLLLLLLVWTARFQLHI